ncbi:MAG: galactitol-1-phosphate 5-dehydrogenase [Spirochaetes bacterium]|nr:galactitol-1-phosphate 5-dehydrogenase [Spirochaetota bacterium]
MKALVLKKNAVLEYVDIPEPKKPGEGFYRIRVAAAGICGSDIHRGFESGAYHYPLVMGHEFSGTVEEAPSGARFGVGRKVVVFPVLWCGKCAACQTGDYAQCDSYDYFGSRRDGGFAEIVWVPEPNLFAVPDDVDILHAAMTEPCAVALHGIRKLRLKGGETAVVYGGGPIGNMAAQWLSILGCGTVIVVEIDDNKARIAERFGFVTVNPEKEDPLAAVREATNGEGAAFAVEACGLPVTYRQALGSVGRFGEVLFLGNPEEDLILPPEEIFTVLRREIIIHGTWNSKPVPRGQDDWTTVLRYMDKKLLMAPLISHTPPLSQGPEIFDRIVGKKERIGKVIFKIQGA